MKYQEMIKNRQLCEFVDEPKDRLIRASSVEAYRKLMDSGAAETQARKIFELLLQEPRGLTYNDLERLTGLRINAICGRMAELRKIELANDELLITSDETRADPLTGVENMVWKINPAYHAPGEVNV